MSSLCVKFAPGFNLKQTFADIFYFDPKSMKRESLLRLNRNLINGAKEYNRMIKTGEVKNQYDRERTLGISRVRVSKVLCIFKLFVKIIEAIEKLFGTSANQCHHWKNVERIFKTPRFVS